MAIPKWVHNNPTTKPLVPLIQEAESAGYRVDFGPTGKKHSSGKKIAADINHDKKLIRLDVTQVMEDFSNKAWTKPQVEGVTGIKHDFSNSGELAKFYLSHELEHMNPENRKPGKADNENATNERAMKRMLPTPKKKASVKAPAATPAPAAGEDLVPHSQELLYALQGLGRKTGAKDIKATVDRLVGDGKVRPGAARLLATSIVYAQDRLRGVSEGGLVTTGTKPLDERYFEGTPSELKAARTKQRSGGRSFYASGLPPELGRVIGETFKSKEGKQYVMRALKARMRSGKAAKTENAKSMLKEVGKDVKLAPEMSLTAKGEDRTLAPERKMNIRTSKELKARGTDAEAAEFQERSPGTPAQLVKAERGMTKTLPAGMKKVDKRKFETIKKRVMSENPGYTEPKANRVALLEMFPHYDRFLRNYGKTMADERKSQKERDQAESAKQDAEDARNYRNVSGRSRRTDQPAMGSPSGVIALRRLVRKFGAPTANPSPRRK